MTMLLISGCATKSVTKMAESSTTGLFSITQLSSGYYHPQDDTLFLQMELAYREKKEMQTACFELPAHAFTQRLKLEEAHKRACSPLKEGYTYLPIIIEKALYIPQYDQNGVPRYVRVSGKGDEKVLKSYRGAIEFRPDGPLHTLYLFDVQNGKWLPLTLQEVSEAKHPEAYLLYPFSVALDVAMFPVMALYYIYDAYFTNAMQP